MTRSSSPRAAILTAGAVKAGDLCKYVLRFGLHFEVGEFIRVFAFDTQLLVYRMQHPERLGEFMLGKQAICRSRLARRSTW